MRVLGRTGLSERTTLRDAVLSVFIGVDLPHHKNILSHSLLELHSCCLPLCVCACVIGTYHWYVMNGKTIQGSASSSLGAGGQFPASLCGLMPKNYHQKQMDEET